VTVDAALRWTRTHTFAHADFPERGLRKRSQTVSVCLPAREEAATIGPIVRELAGLRDRGAIDEVVVVDAASADGTAALATEAGAEVHQQDGLLPHLGPVLGKGDAMWRALTVLRGDIVCYLDADTEQFGEHFARGLVGPLVRDHRLQLVKGSYRRPFRAGGTATPDGGGRVNDLAARPLLNRFYPELAGVRQPLAGEFSARRELLGRLPFFTGYGVEIGLLIDAYRAVGLDGLAQVDLGVRQNRHQSLSELGPMAYAVLGAVCRRLEEDGRLRDAPQESFLAVGDAGVEARDLKAVERPPMSSAAHAAAPPREPGRRAPAPAR
jgi:glucosyl-3-phosphoglycerate synthase